MLIASNLVETRQELGTSFGSSQYGKEPNETEMCGKRKFVGWWGWVA